MKWNPWNGEAQMSRHLEKLLERSSEITPDTIADGYTRLHQAYHLAFAAPPNARVSESAAREAVERGIRAAGLTPGVAGDPARSCTLRVNFEAFADDDFRLIVEAVNPCLQMDQGRVCAAEHHGPLPLQPTLLMIAVEVKAVVERSVHWGRMAHGS